jgi:hypothetical protein
MPSAGQISFVYDQTRMRWMTSLTSGRFQLPLNLTEGNTIDFVFRLSNNGVLFTPALTPVWIFGIKDADTPNGNFLIQVNSATAASGVFTFVVELASSELQTWLATATSQSYAAIQITDSANDIATGPLLCQIEPNQNDTGTTPTSANGTLNVTAGKTVTFPQSLTFPSALGTNGFQLATDGAGALTWTASGALTDGDKGEITVSNSGATFTIDNDVVTLAKLAHMATARVIGRTTGGTGSPELLTISGTGSVAMTNTPTLVTPVLGAATATSINGMFISSSSGIEIYPPGSPSIPSIQMLNAAYTAGSINTNGGASAAGGGINTSNGGGTITTNANGSIGLGIVANRTYLVSTAGNNEKTATFPNVTGTVAVATPSGTTNLALFTTSTSGAPAYRAIATADIATALTTPGPIGGTTASTGAFTTLTSSNTTDSTTTATGAIQTLGGLGVAKSIFAGGIINIPATTSTVGQIKQAGTSLLHSYGTQNLFLGDSAGNFTLTGSSNTGIGRLALAAITSGSQNIALGDGTMFGLTSGVYNLAIGRSSLNALVSGSQNTAIGASALISATGGNLVGIGHQAGYAIGSGNSNVSIGQNSLLNAVNSYATLSSTSNCTLLGTLAEVTTSGQTTASYRTAIGSESNATADNQVMLGRAADIVTLPGGLVTVPEALAPALNAGITVSVAVTATGFALNGNHAATLANGTNGQIKVISCTAVTAAGTATLTPTTSAADYNTIAFTAAGQTATLQYFTTGGWYILSLRGAVAA